MQLWTDYEGVTIDGAFPLKRLLMPEGRSAFFSTAGTHGEPTVLRLIECHFDEEEILSRWRCIESLNHPNFLKFERFGLTQLDNRPVVYAVFETVDGNLAEVLDQGSLSIPDVTQLASSLVAALEVLHTHGFIHEHIEPRNIFAIGTTVKLRGDCIREAPEGEEGRTAKQRDVHALATVLLQGLTQRDSLNGLSDTALPAPFRQIIRNTLNGNWGLSEIKSALPPHIDTTYPPTAPKAPLPPATTTATTAATTAATPSPAPKLAANTSAAPNPSARRQSTPRPAANANNPRAQLPLHKEPAVAFVPRNRLPADHQTIPSRSTAIGVAALLLILITWAIAHTWNKHHQQPAQTATISQSTSQPAQPTAAPALQPNPAPATLPAAAARDNWRVIAFTYNRLSDAEKKASDLAHSQPTLHPTVFTPTGRRPFLVSIGGPLDRSAAYALAHRARSLGLPRDTYAQNYTH